MKNTKLVHWLNVIALKNISKAILAYLFVKFISYVCVIYLVMKGVGLIAQDESNLVYSILIFALGIFIFIVFQFGYFSMIFQMARNLPTRFTYIFLGFKNIKKTWSICLVFTFLLAILLVLSSVISYYYIVPNVLNVIGDDVELVVQQLQANFNLEQDEQIFSAFNLIYASVVVLVFFALVIIFMLPSIFAFSYRLDNGSKSPFYALKQSYVLSFKNANIFRFIGFAFLSCWKSLLIFFIAFVLEFVMSNAGTESSIASMILHFIVFINGYAVLVRLYMSVPVFYNDKTGAHYYPTVEEIKEILKKQNDELQQDDNGDEEES